jgi:UDP-N-acetylmuramate--alanine ligase
LNIPGKHNVFNAAGSIAVALEESIEIQIIQKAISEFSGVGRRYEKHAINVSSKDIILIDDYGHHPIEIDANLSAIKEEFPEKKVCMIFQPHRYTRTEQLFDDFIRVLAGVDSLILLDIYEASEKPIKGIHSKAIAQKIIKQGHSDVIHVTNHSKINKILNLKKDHIDILVTQGAGSISKVCENIIKNV